MPLEHLHVAAAALSPAEHRLSLTPWQVLICIRLHNVPAPSGSQLALAFCAPCRPQTAAQSSAISLSAPCWSLNESANSALIHPPPNKHPAVLRPLLSGLRCPPTSLLTLCTPDSWYPPGVAVCSAFVCYLYQQFSSGSPRDLVQGTLKLTPASRKPFPDFPSILHRQRSTTLRCL